jgi:oligoribonuclease (3'-5' exoribonuclease)
MKIRIHTPSGYASLEELEFPIVLEAHRVGEENVAYVKAHLLRNYGVETDDNDYVFFEEEYTVVEDSVASLLSAMTPSEEEAVDNTGLITACQAISVERQERKAKLFELVQQYGDAVEDVISESVFGTTVEWYDACQKRDSLLDEIKQMVEGL